MVLDGLYNILRLTEIDGELNKTEIIDEIQKCGALNKIKELEQGNNPEIHLLASQIIENFFSFEAETSSGSADLSGWKD